MTHLALVLAGVLSPSAAIQGPDCDRDAPRPVYLGNLEADLRTGEATIRMATREVVEAASAVQVARAEASHAVEQVRGSDQAVAEARAAVAAAKAAKEKCETEADSAIDKVRCGRLAIEASNAESRLFDAESEARRVVRAAEIARIAAEGAAEAAVAARRRVEELEQAVAKLRGLQSQIEQAEACAEPEAERPEPSNRSASTIQRDRTGNFAPKAEDVAERAIQRLKAEDEASHLAIQVEAQEGLSSLVESDPHGAMLSLLVGDAGESALAGAGWAALADKRDRLAVAVAALSPVASLHDLAIATSAATVDPVGMDTELSLRDVERMKVLLVAEVDRRFKEVGNRAAVGMGIRQLADDPAAAQPFQLLIETYGEEFLTTLAMEVVIRDPMTPARLAQVAVRLTPGDAWGAHSGGGQQSGLAVIARQLRSDPDAEQDAMSAFVGLVNRWGFAKPRQRTSLNAALTAESDDEAVHVLQSLADALLEKSLRSMLE